MADSQARLEEARQRALIITEHIRERADVGVRQTIQNFDAHLDFEGRLEDLAIAPEAWAHIVRAQIDPKLVFAHPDLLSMPLELPASLSFVPLCVLRGCPHS